MRDPMTTLFRQAVRHTGNVSQLAKGLGFSRVTLDIYLRTRTPSREGVRRLAKWLREHATRSLAYARELEQYAKQAGLWDDDREQDRAARLGRPRRAKRGTR